MRTLYLLILIVGVVGLFVWVYFGMIRVCPRVVRPSRGPEGITLTGLERDLFSHVKSLATDIGPRNVFNPKNYTAAYRYIRQYWETVGYEVAEENFEAEGEVCRNIIVERRGTAEPEKWIIIGAHYDTVAYSPGANDNGSAVAVLLELSRMLKRSSFPRTIRFVAFANEEPPFFKTGKMGSVIHAQGCRQRGESIEAMICLETLGYYREKRGTQKYPFPLSAFYPDRANFLAIVGNLRSRVLVQSFARFFMEESDFPVECAAPVTVKLPLSRAGSSVLLSLPGIDWSDHQSFWIAGYPAIMLTDTALFRYPYYHSLDDTPDKLNYSSLARVTHGIYKAVARCLAHHKSVS